MIISAIKKRTVVPCIRSGDWRLLFRPLWSLAKFRAGGVPFLEHGFSAARVVIAHMLTIAFVVIAVDPDHARRAVPGDALAFQLQPARLAAILGIVGRGAANFAGHEGSSGAAGPIRPLAQGLSGDAGVGQGVGGKAKTVQAGGGMFGRVLLL